MDSNQSLKLLKKFWKMEMMAADLYKFLARRTLKERREGIVKIGKMEQGHANVWNNIAKKGFNQTFELTFFIRLRIFFMKLLSFIFPKTIFIHYMELGERNAIIEYSKILESFQEDEKISRMIENVIRDEVKHEWHMMELVADKSPYIRKAKEAMHGLLAGILESIALIIGFVAADLEILFIGLATLIATLTGLITIVTIAYLSSKSHYDIHVGEKTSLKVKHEIEPSVLKSDLVNLLVENGLKSETADSVVNIIEEDTEVLQNLIRNLRQLEAEHMKPKEAVTTVSSFFLLGAIPTIIPFFIYAFIEHANILHPLIIAGCFALLVLTITGVYTGVLSNKRPAFEILKYLAIVVVTSAITYLIGFIASIFLGAGVGH